MKRSEFNDSYRVFPYRAETHREGVNNGGINLVENPNEIELITEASEFPALRKLLVRLNEADAATMTLGCAYWPEAEMVQGYFEFSFREIGMAQDEIFIAGIDQQFYSWLTRWNPQLLALRPQIESSLAWEYSSFQYYETSPRLKIAVWYRASHQQAASQLLDWLTEFLRHHVPFPNSMEN